MEFNETKAFAELCRSFEGHITITGDPDYADATLRWSRLYRRMPRAIAKPRTCAAIVAILKYVLANKVDFAVKGGGCNPSGASVSYDLVIDLSKYMKDISLDEVAGLVYVQGGATWAHVDAVATAAGYGTVGSNFSLSGVGGMALCGGVGLLSGRHGLAIDNLVGVEMVLADGTFVRVNEEKVEDLYWAVRGAGANSGIVTRFIMKIHPLPSTCWGGALTFPAEQAGAVCQVLKDWQADRKTADDNAQVLFVSRSRSDGEEDVPRVLTVICSHIGYRETGERSFRPFLALNSVGNTCREKAYIEDNKQLDPMYCPRRFYLMTTASIGFSSFHLGPKIWKLQKDFIEAHEHQAGADQDKSIQCVIGIEGPSTAKIMEGSNMDMAFHGRTESKTIVITFIWDHSRIDKDYIRGQARKMVDAIQGTVNCGPANMGYEGDQERVATFDKSKEYFGPNYTRLQALKAKYDPDCIFSSWFPIEPQS